jgi:hypothetical protein
MHLEDPETVTEAVASLVSDSIGLAEAGPAGQFLAALAVSAFVCPFVNLLLTAVIVGFATA